MSSVKQPIYSIKGKTIDPGSSTARLEDIVISEYTRSFEMGDNGEQPYGLAVDANLAVKLIKNLLEILPEDTRENLFTVPPVPLTDANLTTMDTKGLLDEVLKLSYGITFDKSIVLKILSQPKCEGLRSYLCLQNDERPHLSLVLVGVDEGGKDLNYETAYVNQTTSIPTESLTSEYGHPPSNGFRILRLADPRYVLLNLANQLIDTEQTQQQQQNQQQQQKMQESTL